jgi:hypothetical protein
MILPLADGTSAAPSVVYFTDETRINTTSAANTKLTMSEKNACYG